MTNLYVACGPSERKLRELRDNSIDMTMTSPPYDDVREYNGFRFGPDECDEIADELLRVTKPGGVVVWVVGDQTRNGSETGTSAEQCLAFRDAGWKIHDTMIYRRSSPPYTHRRYEQAFEFMYVFCKGNNGPRVFNGLRDPKEYMETKPRKKAWHRWADGSYKQGIIDITDETRLRNNVWWYGKAPAEEKIAHQHPAIFPEILAHDHIYSWSNPGDVILDPFMGSGTTLKMAYLMGRNYVGIDISPDYVTLAKERLAECKRNMTHGKLGPIKQIAVSA